MSELFRKPSSGDSILYYFHRLMDVVRRERVMAGDGILIKQTESGKTISVIRHGGTGATEDPADPGIPGGDANGTGGSDSGTKLGHVYAFESYANDDNDGIFMEPGDIVLGPLTWIHWADITDADTTPAVSATDTCVWLEVNVEAESAAMKYGARAAMESALDSTEQLNTLVVPLVETFWTAGAIVKVKNRQCGDVLIARAAG